MHGNWILYKRMSGNHPIVKPKKQDYYGIITHFTTAESPIVVKSHI